MGRPNQAPLEVICVGLGRTGTASMAEALEILGFGPAYHVLKRVVQGKNDMGVWYRFAKGDDSPEAWDEFLQDYHSLLDYPAAISAESLYAAYPDAKYVLTTRDPAKWADSVMGSVMGSYQTVKTYAAESSADYIKWFEEVLLEYHHGRLTTAPEQELLDHNEKIKKLIPADQLLVYEVGEGWERLANFLGVPVPAEPFPRVNERQAFQDLHKTVGWKEYEPEK